MAKNSLLMHGVLAGCLFVCTLLSIIGASYAALQTHALTPIPSYALGVMVAAALLARPDVADALVRAEKSFPLAFGLAYGAATACSFFVIALSGAQMAVCASAALAGLCCWFTLVLLFSFADVLSVPSPLLLHSIAAAVALAVCLIAVRSGQMLGVFVVCALVGIVLLLVELLEGKEIEEDREKPLVNIFVAFNSRAPLANAVYGAVFGLTVAFSIAYRINLIAGGIVLIVGFLAAGLVPLRQGDRRVSEAIAIVLACCLVALLSESAAAMEAANSVLLGCFGFYVLRNIRWAFGKCVQIGNLDTAVLSRALSPLAIGVFAGTAAAACLVFFWNDDAIWLVDAAALIALFFSTVFFLPGLSEERSSRRLGAETGQPSSSAASDPSDGGEAPAEAKGEESALEARFDVMRERFGLTSREMDILRLLCKGRTAEYIGKELFISKNTARVHIYHIYGKMDIHSQQELIEYAETLDTQRDG